MRADYTHVSILLDRSGSMDKIKTDVIGGYNNFIKEQRGEPGKLTVTLAQFDHHMNKTQFEVLADMEDVQAIVPLTEHNFIPRGLTPLLDSAARLIHETGERLSKMKEEDRPSKVVILMITDGVENASEEYSKATLKTLIEQQKKDYNWQFIYIGANQDAFAEAAAFGAAGVTFTADAVGTQANFAANTRSMKNYRSGATETYSLSQEDVDEEDAKLRTNKN